MDKSAVRLGFFTLFYSFVDGAEHKGAKIQGKAEATDAKMS